MLVFLLDAVNADVLFAAIQGDIRMEDNPLILDSQFDTTSVAPDGGHTVNYFQLVKFAAGASSVARHNIPHFLGTTLVEDADSPTVLDGADTRTLNFHTTPYYSCFKIKGESVYTTLDRTITFACLLI